MSRIRLREAVAASVAACAVMSMCVAGGLVASGEASASGDATRQLAGDRALVSGSYMGVWFNLSAGRRDATPAVFLTGALGGVATGTWYDPHPHTAASTDAAVAAHAARAATDLAASRSSARAALPPAAPQPPAAKAAVQHQPAAAPPQPAAPAPAPAQPQPAAAVSGDPRSIAQAMAANRGWSGAQWTCLDQLWMHESTFETTVRNPTSGAYGIPQALPGSKMAAAGADWRTNPATQISWGLNYIAGRYGSPCEAWSYWLRHYSY